MIYWDLRGADEHPALALGEAPAGLLSAPEQVFLRRLATPKRRGEWILGRYAAKALCRAWLARQGRRVSPASLTVAAAPDGAPFVLLKGEGPLPVTISLSHRAGAALVALVEAPRAALGADLEWVEPRAPSFVESFFTPAEAAAVASSGDPDRTATEIWSVKEAALKGVRLGLRADTRAVEVRPRPNRAEGWARVEVGLALAGAPERATAFVRDAGHHLLSLTLLDAGPDVEPADELRSWPALDVAA